jgi:hypothetical protein
VSSNFEKQDDVVVESRKVEFGTSVRYSGDKKACGWNVLQSHALMLWVAAPAARL